MKPLRLPSAHRVEGMSKGHLTTAAAFDRIDDAWKCNCARFDLGCFDVAATVIVTNSASTSLIDNCTLVRHRFRIARRVFHIVVT